MADRHPDCRIERVRSLESRRLHPEVLAGLGIRAIAFDKDGTLIDSLGAWAQAERDLAGALSRRYSLPGMEAEPLERAMLAAIGVRPVGYDPQGIMATGSTELILSAMHGALSTCLEQEPTAESFGEAAGRELALLYPGGIDTARPMRGAQRLLDMLGSAGMPLALVTADGRANTMAELDALGWRSRFGFLACADDAGEPKPSPHPILDFARGLGLPPSRIAVVGDGHTDESMAIDAGAGLFVRLLS